MQNKSSNHFQDLTWEVLSRASRTSLPAFNLQLADTDHQLICQDIIRIIPKKRLVAFGLYAGKPVVVKLFYQSNRAAHHANRDAAGIKALQTSGVLSPAIYYQGTSKDKRIHVLIFEKIEEAKSLAQCWQERENLEKIAPLMHVMVLELATQHVLGILQNDLHFKNFLVQKKKIYTIDGGDIKIFNTPLSKKDSIANLGLFFAQLGVGTTSLQEALFKTYVKSRGWIIKKNDLSSLKLAIVKYTKQRCEQYSQKVMRNCSAFVRLNTATSLTVYDRDEESDELIKLLKNPEAGLPATELLKAGRTATVSKIFCGDKAMVLKRYNIKNTWHWLRRCLRPTRAAAAWQLGQHLRLLGIATAKPIAFVEKSFLGLRGKSYLLTEYIGGEDIGHYLTNPMRDTSFDESIMRQVISLFESLAECRITHGDLKMTNILIAKQKPILIDLDGMRIHRSTNSFKRAFQEEIERFMRNWRDHPTIYKMFEKLVSEMQIQ